MVYRDETYRSVRFMEEESCEEVLDRLWPRLDLQGERHDYKFYIVYRKEGELEALAVPRAPTSILCVQE